MGDHPRMRSLQLEGSVLFRIFKKDYSQRSSQRDAVSTSYIKKRINGRRCENMLKC